MDFCPIAGNTQAAEEFLQLFFSLALKAEQCGF